MCYCGKDLSFEACCQPLILGKKPALDAEQLMRSRYSAYCVNACEYIHKTYAQSYQTANPVAEIAAFAELANFIKLEVFEHKTVNDTATVHFRVHYLCDGYYCQLEELSHFVTEQGLWRYTEGEITPHVEVKLGRNDSCPCGSNKKYKKCHSR